MSLSLSRVSVPVWVQFLGSLSVMLDKTAAHVAAKKINPSALLDARLFPDMFTLTKQVQLVSDFAKGAAARLAGVEVPSWADDEKTFEDLKNRLARTLHFIHGLDKNAIDGAVDREITFNVGPNVRVMKGADYLIHYALPNFYFHHTTAYDLLRHNGVEVGKRDFMGQVPGI
jgi:hypothetical protein